MRYHIAMRYLKESMMITLSLGLCACTSHPAASPASAPASTPTADPIEKEIENMSLEEKISQLFILIPDDLTGHTETSLDEDLKDAISQYQPGGFIYFADNITDPDTTGQFLKDTRQYYLDNDMPIPLLSVDEEGGTVARIGSRAEFHEEQFEGMREIGETHDVSKALHVGETIGTYLHDLGFNMDFAPVADVLSNPDNTVVYDRSFGSDPKEVTAMAQAVSDGLMNHHVIPVWKHYPGHGGTAEDSHAGMAYTGKTLDELLADELIPFAEGNMPVIMAGHIAAPNVTGSNTPASLSHTLITDILRNRLGFDGVVITDSMVMGAIANTYTSGEAALAAIQAGCDIILIPENFTEARQALIDAVHSGTLSEERINTSVSRILKLKQIID